MIPGWQDESDAPYLKILQDLPTASPYHVATRLNVSECCAVYWLAELAKRGKIRILAVELVKEGEMPCDQQSSWACTRKDTCPALEAAEKRPPR